MDLLHLRAFVSVYRNKGFTRASEEMRLSQPTISEHIRNLESELGCTLFERLARTVVPTREAEAMFPRALHILEEAERLREEVSLMGGEVKGKLLLGASTIPGTYILPPIAMEFAREHEGVSFEIVIGDSGRITERVLSHEIMLGFVGAVMEPQKLLHVPVTEDELILAVPPAMFRSESIPPRGVLELPFILREEGSGTMKIMEHHLKTKDIDVKGLNVVAVLGSTDAVKQAIKAGLGASIISRVAADEDIGRGTIREVKLRGLKMTRSFFMIMNKKRIFPTPYREFYDYMNKGFSPEASGENQ